jgi:hypothetical protein
MATKYFTFLSYQWIVFSALENQVKLKLICFMAVSFSNSRYSNPYQVPGQEHFKIKPRLNPKVLLLHFKNMGGNFS